MATLGKYRQELGIEGTVDFFTVIPEQIETFFTDNKQLFLENSGITSNHFKSEMYSQYFTFKKRKKYTGFENFKAQDEKVRQELRKKNGNEFKVDVVVNSDIINRVSSNLTKLERTGKEFSNFKEACIEAAKLIEQDANGKEIYLALSGGIDSELMSAMFIEAGVPFTAFTVNYNGLNDYDTKYAYEFCKKHNIQQVTENLDLEDFFSSEVYDIADVVGTTSPQMAVYQKIISLIADKGAYPVLAGEIRMQQEELSEDFEFELSWKGESPAHDSTSSFEK